VCHKAGRGRGGSRVKQDDVTSVTVRLVMLMWSWLSASVVARGRGFVLKMMMPFNLLGSEVGNGTVGHSSAAVSCGAW